MIYLGTSGWSYNHWIGKFYPENMDRREWLSFYAKHFTTAEINSTFYRFPFRNVLKGWYRKTPRGFVFSLKANRIITHVRKLRNIEDVLERFYESAEILQENLGPVLFQFPPSLKKDLNLLSDFLEKLDKKYKNVIEFRHESWFCKEVYSLLKKYEAGYCIVSAPRLPCEIEVTGKFAYIRWHGSEKWYSYDYTEDELKYWAETIRKLSGKCEEVYGYFNNDYEGYAVKNCLRLKEMLGI